MIEACTPERLLEWWNFLDRAFGYEPPQSYRVDFAPLFEFEALPSSRLLIVDGKIASSAALHPATVLTAAGPVRFGVIGAVATEEVQRGRGYSNRVLLEIEKAAGELRLDVLILWSDKAEFYEKMGFHAAGKQEIYSLDNLPGFTQGARTLRPIGGAREGWTLNAVRSLYTMHRLRSERTDRYWNALAKITSCRRMEWVGKDGLVNAYLGFHRGRDMQNIIHEWGGEARALHALVLAALENNPALLWLTCPALEDPIRALLPRGESPVLEGQLALVKPLRTLPAGAFDSFWFWGLDSL
ncbi:MAG: GNAT family N-acetyltransferase [Deltaproteobacteria bacterium]|nr:GNAT family N-acetyltransferase [Deltaproteobacteria bacterium]